MCATDSIRCYVVQDVGVDHTDFNYTHTMLRVKDPKKSLHFYCNILGMTCVRAVAIVFVHVFVYVFAKKLLH